MGEPSAPLAQTRRNEKGRRTPASLAKAASDLPQCPVSSPMYRPILPSWTSDRIDHTFLTDHKVINFLAFKNLSGYKFNPQEMDLHSLSQFLPEGTEDSNGEEEEGQTGTLSVEASKPQNREIAQNREIS